MTPPADAHADATTPVELVPRTGRARNRLAEHKLEIVRPGTFRGSRAVLTRCTRPGCGWRGWFTDTEMTVDHVTTEPSGGGEDMTYTVQLADRTTGWVIRQLAGVDLTAALAAKTQWVREFHPVDHLVDTPLDEVDDWAHKPVRMAVHVTITHAT